MSHTLILPHMDHLFIVYHIVAGAIADEINSVIYLRFVLANRMNVEAQRICGKSKNSHFYYFTKLKQGRIKMTLKNKL